MTTDTVENISLGRIFRVKERASLQIRAEFANMFNRTEMNNPTATNPLATAELLAIQFFDRPNVYPPKHTDGQTTYLRLMLNGKKKTIKHSDDGPGELDRVEHAIERLTNIHRWLHGDPRRRTLLNA